MNTKHLKAKILDLAIRGKLVPQNSSEGNASDLLKEIKKNHTDLQISTKSADKKNSVTKKELPPITQEEIPFDIPENWCWCRLGEICNLKGGKRIPAGLSATKEKTKHIYIRVTDMKDDSISDSDLCYINDSIFEKIKQYTIGKDDLYLTIAGTIGKVGEVPKLFDKMNLTENALKLTNIKINKKYLLNVLKSPYVQEYFESTYHQVAMPKLSLINASKTHIPLPPLAEQQRIVCAIEKAFEQIDVIEKNKLKLKTYIKQTKSKVLDLAIHGKLVPQNSFEGNASDLLKEIKRNHTDLQISTKSADKKSRDLRSKSQIRVTKKELPPITQEEIPFELPENWSWCRLGSLLSIKSGDLLKVGENQTGEYPIYGGNGINGYYSKYNVEANTIIIGRVGFYCGSIHVTKNKAWVTDNAFITNFNSKFIQIDYLTYLLKKLDLRTKSNSTAQPVVSGRGIYPIPIPLPPLAEQQRIVAKIEQIFAQLNALEKSLGE